MTCHETYHIGGTFEEANRPAALETYHFVRFMVRFVAGHPHMPSKRSKKNWPSFLDRFVDFAFENPGAKNTQNAMAKFPSGSPGASASSIRTARQRRQKAIRQAPRLTSTAPSHSATPPLHWNLPRRPCVAQKASQIQNQKQKIGFI